MKGIIFSLFCASVVLIGTGCEKQYQAEQVMPGKMIINNDLSILSRRMAYSVNEPSIKFEDKSAASKGEGVPSATIQLIARLLPPEYNGEVLQASHVRIAGNYAYVAYNTQGSRYLGGVDVVDVTVPEVPQVISSVLFINPATNQGKDVSSVDIRESLSGTGTTLWVTGADEATGKAFIEKYELNSSHQFVSADPVSISLKGYTGTDVRFFKDKVYVTTGTDGGLTVLNNDMSEVSYTEVKMHVRWM